MGCAGRGLTTPAEGLVEYARGHRVTASRAAWRTIFYMLFEQYGIQRRLHPCVAHEQEQFRSVQITEPRLLLGP